MRGAAALALGLLLVLTTALAASAQSEGGLIIEFHRDFGYSAGGEIQGAFSLTAEGPVDLVRVDYFLDDQPLGSAASPPFRISFNTGTFTLGRHTFTAVGTTAGGGQVRSANRTLEFVSAEAGWQTAGQIVVPILGLVVVIAVLGTAGPMLFGRRTVFRLEEYGAAGGAVCGKCGMPFSRHFFSLNMVLGKLERCPHCGKWAIVPAASTSALKQAEARWQADSQQGELKPEGEADRLRDRIDESRYES
jgi:hypothetical protein